MANTKLPISHMNVKGFDDLLGFEQVTIGDASESLATAGATLPNGTTRIIVQAAAALHWTPNGTATATFAHAVAANHFFVLEKDQLASEIFSDDDNDQNVLVAYFGHWNP